MLYIWRYIKTHLIIPSKRKSGAGGNGDIRHIFDDSTNIAYGSVPNSDFMPGQD